MLWIMANLPFKKIEKFNILCTPLLRIFIDSDNLQTYTIDIDQVWRARGEGAKLTKLWFLCLLKTWKLEFLFYIRR